MNAVTLFNISVNYLFIMITAIIPVAVVVVPAGVKNLRITANGKR